MPDPVLTGGCLCGGESGRGGIRTPGRRCRRQRFSRPPHSTALPPFQGVLDEVSTRCYDGKRGRGSDTGRLRVSPRGDPRLYTGGSTSRRGGRVAEGTRLLSEYGDQTPSRVRIPPSPSPQKQLEQAVSGESHGRRPSGSEPELGELKGGPSSARMADDGDVLQFEVVQECGDLAHPLRWRKGAGWRLSVGRQIDAEDLALVGEVGQQWLPYAAGAVGSVQEHERGSGALSVERKHVNICIPHA